ncbi:hypothetical protein [Hymenobacter cavernae]|uniref:Glycerophosphoryl diester phosphodiesterase membrane domain-containing protein n=1 Tax=Hymenobacter cavernae TaxID=2044852 RepID=A0ABQ1TFQ8_9BACT|nr:hypothetical protein [Hymenobacter cavernae]GGE94414.1 hypothetical protein GCM10011383_01420 [Hymenobacter cavernae]
MPRLSFTQPADFLKERDFGQKLEATFDFIRAHFKPLGKCLLYIVLPIALLNGIMVGLLQARLGSYFRAATIASRTGGTMNYFSFSEQVPQSLLFVVTGLITFALGILTVYGYMVLRLHQEDPTAEISVAEVWAFVRRRLLGTILAFIGLAICFMLLFIPFFGMVFLGGLGAGSSGGVAFLFLLIPVCYCAFLYMGVTLSLFFIIWVREELGFFATLRRCFYLIWGKWWSTFGLLVVMSMIVSLIMLVLVMPVSFLNVWSLVKPDDTPVSPILTVAANSFSTIAIMLLYTLIFIALAFQYFNLVERKDGEGLRSLVDRLGQPAAAAPLHPDDHYRPEEEGDY